MQTDSFSWIGAALLVGSLALTACGSDVVASASSQGASSGEGGAGAGGQGGSQTSASTMDGMCDGDPCCTGQAPPGQCCASECCPDFSCSTGGSGGSGVCGGKAGIPCSPNTFCDFGNDLCGGADEQGICMPRPDACPNIYEPVCACDGKVYGNSCEANAAGIDVSNNGGCPAPSGTFACGDTFCSPADSYCMRSASDVGGTPDGYSCQPLPAACPPSVPPTCDCLKGEPCGSICQATPDGGLELTCPGG